MKFEFDYECDKDWDEMKGGDRQRFCDSCDKHVHHISAMSEKQAKEFLERHNYEVCVDFYRDGNGHTKFREKARMLDRQNDGLKQLVASALAIVPLALGAAFIDFDQSVSEPDVVISPNPSSTPSLPPLVLGSPTVAPSQRPDIQPLIPDITPEPIVDITPEPIIEDTPEPVIEELPDLEPEPVVRPPRPHVRGKIAPPKDWNPVDPFVDL